jgi:ATP-dependent Zn protease
LAQDLGIMKEIRRNTLTVPSEEAVTGATQAEKRATNLLFATLSESALKSDAGPQAYQSLRDMVVRNEQHKVSDVEVQIDDTKLRAIVARLGIPSTQVKKVLTNLEDKLTRSPQAPNLKVLFK